MKIYNGCAKHFNVSADYIYKRFISMVIPTDFDMWEMRWEDHHLHSSALGISDTFIHTFIIFSCIHLYIYLRFYSFHPL